MKIVNRLPALLISLFALHSSSAEAQTVHIVNQAGVSFSPANVTVKAGDTVRWVWSNGNHTVTEGTDGIVNGNEAFHSALNAGTSTFEVTFDSAFLAANPRTDNTYHYFCVPHFTLFDMKGKVVVVTPWTDLGFAKPGTSGNPQLEGLGDLYPGSPSNLNLSNANPSSLAILFINFGGHTPVSFIGGTLAAFPVTANLVLFTSGSGQIPLPFAFPSGVPTGSPIVFQYGIADAGATEGASLSNAMRAVTP